MPLWIEIPLGMSLGCGGCHLVFWLSHRLGGPSWQQVADYSIDTLVPLRMARMGDALAHALRKMAIDEAPDVANSLLELADAVQRGQRID
jgi:hypothetical protein